MKILIVDDDRTILAILGDMLVELGHEVVSARDGFEALTAFRRARPTLVFLDYNLPRMSGLEVLKTIKHEVPETFVVLFTRLSAETVSRLGGTHRADALIEKPVRKQDLERLVARAAQRRATPR